MKTTFYSVLLLVAIVATLLCVVNLENGEGFRLASSILALVDIYLYLKVTEEAKKDPDYNE